MLPANYYKGCLIGLPLYRKYVQQRNYCVHQSHLDSSQLLCNHFTAVSSNFLPGGGATQHAAWQSRRRTDGRQNLTALLFFLLSSYPPYSNSVANACDISQNVRFLGILCDIFFRILFSKNRKIATFFGPLCSNLRFFLEKSLRYFVQSTWQHCPYCSLPLRQPRNDTLPCRTEPLLLVMQDRKENTKVLKLVFKGSSHHVRSKRVEQRQLFKQKAMNVDTAPSSGRVENEYITISYIPEYTLSALRICVSFSRTRLHILVGNKGREKKSIFNRLSIFRTPE